MRLHTDTATMMCHQSVSDPFLYSPHLAHLQADLQSFKAIVTGSFQKLPSTCNVSHPSAMAFAILSGLSDWTLFMSATYLRL